MIEQKSDTTKMRHVLVKQIKKAKPKDWNNIPIPVSELLQ